MRVCTTVLRAAPFLALAASCAAPGSPAHPAPGPARFDAAPPSPASAAPSSPIAPSAHQPAQTPGPAPDNAASAAAIVWTPAQGGPGRFHSIWIEPSGPGAAKIAERKETVVVGADDLWVLRARTIKSQACDECELCTEDPPRCRKNADVTLTEPYLVSLRDGRSLRPFEQAFKPLDGCASTVGEHGVEASIEGAVGTVVFGSVSTHAYYCGAAHSMYGDEVVTFSADSGAKVDVSFPPGVEPLRKAAQKELVAQGCVMDEKEKPADYRATAEYDTTGTLRGRYSFTMSAPYVCGTGPGHYSVENTQDSPEIPPELAAWRRLPAWVAGFMSAANAQYAFVIPPARVAAAKAEFTHP